VTSRKPRERLSISILPPFLALATWSAATSADAKVLRSTARTAMVSVFRDAYALDRFSKLPDNARSDATVRSLLTCSVPQGRIDVLGSGYRTAYVRVIDRSASGCEGTVPIGNVRDQ